MDYAEQVRRIEEEGVEKIARVSWRERIERAEQRGWFLEEDRILAGWWGTCAVGEQQQKMPEVRLITFDSTSMVEDKMLARLGSTWAGFTAAVFSNEPAEARKFLDAIEDRALQIKRGEA